MPIELIDNQFIGMNTRLLKSLDAPSKWIVGDSKITIDNCRFVKSSKGKYVDNKIKFLYYLNCGRAKVEKDLIYISGATFVIKYNDRRSGFDPLWFMVDLAEYWTNLLKLGVKKGRSGASRCLG